MEKTNPHLKSSLKLLRLEKDKVKEAEVRASLSHHHIFIPSNDLEIAAIAIATEGVSGWKGSLYSLDYYDRYLENTCFILATEPKIEKDNNWLLVAFNSKDNSKYWIALGEKNLSEVYYAWAKVVQLSNPQFDSQRMAEINYVA